MKAIKETEKAIQLEIRFENSAAEKNLSRKVWIPKSQIRDEKLTSWIFGQKIDEIQKDFRSEICEVSVFDAEGNEIEIEETEKDRRSREKFSAAMNKILKKA